MADPVRRGDLVHHGALSRALYVVLAVSDGYAVLRRPGRKPLVVEIDEVEKWNG